MTKRAVWLLTCVLGACSSGGGATPDGAAGRSAGAAGGAAGAAGKPEGVAGATGGAGTSGGAGGAGPTGGAGATSTAGVAGMIPPPTGAGGAVTPVGATPPAAWTNVTANLAGMPSECGNTSLLASHPARDLLLTTVAKHGLWASTDGGASWQQLWPAAGMQQITNRGSSFVFDPAHPMTFWESGIYIDSVSVDLGDPRRQTLLAGGHEQKQTLYRSADGGTTWTNVGANLPAGTNFCTNALVLDANTHLVGCSGYAGGTDGVFRTTDGGKTWAPATTASAAAVPLWASDGTIYWSLVYDRGLIKSTDQGKTWTQTIQGGTLKTGHPIELPDGRIVAPGPKTLMISRDKGVSFQPLGEVLPFAPNSITYSPYRNAFFIEQFDCGNAVVANAISRAGFDYRVP
jgi:hypothetical protein